MPFNSLIPKLLTEANHVNGEAFDQNMAALQLFVKDPNAENQLRFIIFSSGGLGHQSTAANIIYRMVSLGLKGTFEIIYFKNDIEKIAILFPQFDPKNPFTPVIIGDATFIFIDEETFIASEQPIFKIGLTGGVDGLQENIAKYFYVEYLLVLQPYQWKLAPSVIQRANEIPLNKPIDTFKPLEALSFAKRGYYIADPVMDAANINYFKTSVYADKYPVYDLITTSLLAQKTNMMPVYGLNLFDNSSILAATVLFNLATGITIAQNKTNEVGGKVKGTIMVIISKLEDEVYTDFEGLIQGTNPELENNPLKEWIAKNNLSSRISTYKYNDAGLPDAIKSLEEEPDKTLVINMGALPLYAFNYLYLIADMPAVFEGAATNSLLLNFGKDYFALTSHLNKTFTLYPTLPLNAEAAATVPASMKEVSLIIGSNLLDWQRDLNDGSYDVPADLLALAILIAFEPENTAGQLYFSSLRTFFHNQQEDKMLMGVFFLLQYLNHYKK